MNETLFSALEFNFNRLEDDVKEVFLLCGMHGRSILVHDLLKYASGLSIFKNINTIEDARNRLYRIIHDMKASCLLIDDDPRTEKIKMHDLVSEVAISIASKFAFTKSQALLQDWPKNDIPKRCTHIILNRCCIQKLPERLDCPHLTFFHMNSFDNPTLKIPDSFFEGLGNLESLDLTGMIIASLPRSFSSLIKLKTLCLDHCTLKDMTGIGALINLEILSLIHSSLEEFPSEIEQLTKLRMLDLSRSGIGTVHPNILGKLTKIEELYMGDATINWEVESSTKQKRNASLAMLGNLTSLTTLEIQIREASVLPKDIPFDKLERYKVVIGDKWAWSDIQETSRLLKVKLDTSIHHEGGIKTLIKRVEDLYLDNLSGVSTVLFELNGDGFPLLKNVHIQNSDEIRHIINSTEINETRVLFPKLETMVLHNLKNLVKICHDGPLGNNSFGKLKVIKVKSCDQLEYLFSVSMVKTLTQLTEIEVSECSSIREIVYVEGADSGESIDEKIEFLQLHSLTLQNLPIMDKFCTHESMSCLRTTQNSFFNDKVKFCNLETLKLSSVNLKKLWDDNQSSAGPYLIQNLANLTIEDCSGLKYLFSSSMAERLSNLKQLEISKCDMMEQIIATEEINGTTLGEVLFPKLEAIIIRDMQNLKMLWHDILPSNSLTCFKTLEVKNCDKIEKIFPEYMNGAFATLETLKVKGCNSVREIFELGFNIADTTQLKYMTLLRLPQLKQIWSRGSQSRLHFKNLQVVRVEDCEDLEFLFPLSIAKHLSQLEKVTLKNAVKMREIVSEKEEPLDNHVKFEFNQLTSIVIWNLQNLQGFCAGNYSLSCSSLKELDVYNCEKLKLFKTQGTSSQDIRLSGNNLQASMQQPLFTLEEVIDNLEDLRLNNEDASIICQSQVLRDQFRKLNFLGLYELEDDQAISPYWFLQNISSLECLVIQDNSSKEIFPNERSRDENGEIEIKTRLKKLTLYRLYELEYICKEGSKLDPVLEVLEYLDVDECSKLKHLLPSSVTLYHLTYLEVQNCNGLIDLISSSTARSLAKLTTLKIRECDLVDQIVVEEGGESNNEIEFNSLKVLELESLPKLNCFGYGNCYLKLPLLEKLVIKQCPRMKTFSRSGTRAQLLREIITDEDDNKWFCDGDLNSTVNKIFLQKVAFRSCEHLQLSQYPELKEVWYNHNVQPAGMFGKLRKLAVKDCDFLSDVLLSLNLLQGLPNLDEVDVSGCDSLEAVFDLTNMNEKENIHLKTVTLSHLPRLKHIWKQNSHQIVSFDDAEGSEISKVQGAKETTKQDKADLQHLPQASSMGQVLFPNLETLIIKDMPELNTIWHPCFFSSNSLSSLKTMEVSKCEKLDNIFPSYMKRAFTSLKTLMVSDCNSIQVIFEFGSEMDSAEDTTQLQNLTLLRLSKLRQIWNRDPQSSICFKSLQVVHVEDCADLVYLFPFSVAKHLPQLEEITIKEAAKMKEIVSKREDSFDNLFSVSLCQDLTQLEELHVESCGVEEIVSIEEELEEVCKFDFPRLSILNLLNLTQITNFYPKRYILECPLLKKLNVRGCEELQIFAFDHSNSQALEEGDIELQLEKALFYIEKVSQNLEELPLNEEDTMSILNGNYKRNPFQSIKCLRLQNFQKTPIKFLNDLIQIFPSITTLQARCSSFEILFPSEEIVHCSVESPTQIKELWLFQLEQLEDIWNDDGSASHPLVQNLEHLLIGECSRIIRLAPPSASFINLTSLKVIDCSGLMYFMTSNTAKSLVRLTFLVVINCPMLEEIVMADEGDSDKEITFESLKYLELTCLSGFKRFCSAKHTFKFPSLVTLKVIGCNEMQSFSYGVIIAPFLKLVQVENGKKRWKEDLNTTIKQLFMDKESASTSKELISSEEHGVASKADEISDIGKQEMHKRPIPHTALGTQDEIIEGPLVQDTHHQNTDKLQPNIKNHDMYKTLERALVPVAQNLLSSSTVDKIDIRNEEMYQALEKASVPVGQNVLSSSMIDNIAIDPSPSQVLEVETSSIQDEDGLKDLHIFPSENLFVQATTSSMNDDKENTGNIEMHEIIQRSLVQNVEDMLIPDSVQDKATENHVTHESTDKPYVQAAGNTWDLTIVQEKEESHDSDIHLSKNLFNQTTISIVADYKEAVRTQKTYESKRNFLVHDAQNLFIPTLVDDTAIDPSPS